MRHHSQPYRRFRGRGSDFLIACARSVGAAALAIAVALIAIGALAFVIDALRTGGSAEPVRVAAETAGAAFYLSQLVGLSFFGHTGELRFAALPGLLLIGLPIVAVTALVARRTPGTRRRKAHAALGVAVPYALIAGLGALFVPLHFTARGFGQDIAVQPAALESFLLPLAWALLFSATGALVGVFGRQWRQEAARLLGSWAAPVGVSLRVLAIGLAAGTAVTITTLVAAAGGEIRSFAFGGLGHFLETVAAAIVALPTLIATALLASFGTSVDWRLDALGHGDGALSAFGGALPGTGPDPTAGPPAVFALLPLVGLATVLAVGWLTARRSGDDVRLSLGNAIRAATVLTLTLWSLGMLARIDAQAGGLLGFHFAPDATSLLWHVPLWSFLGCFLGASAQVVARGAEARRRFAQVLVGALDPSRVGLGGAGRLDPTRDGLPRRAGAGIAFAAVPLAVFALGSPSGAPSPEPAKISYAPIAREAEHQLEADSTSPAAVDVTVNPATRELGTATVSIPVQAVDAKPSEPPAAKARAVLAEHGELFGLTSRPAELGHVEVSTDELGMTHVQFDQMAAGVPVFGSQMSVHFSPNGQTVDFLSGSVAPDVHVAEPTAKLDGEAAVARAKATLPAGELVRAPALQVYVGTGPVISGPSARLAWFVWLLDSERQVSNEYVIDAVDGKVLKVFNKDTEARNRLVYNANNGATLPGTLARSEGGAATGNKDVDNAYTFSGDTYDMYSSWFGRDSYDGKGATLKSSAHFRSGYENAFWNGLQMVYGDGFASAEDVVGHELTHAVTEYTSGLVYEWQSGALNEAFSDIMGESLEYFKKGSNDWLMGAALPIGAIRSLKEPNEYFVLGQPGPKQMSEWYGGCEDNFGVHVNSTIVGHAYYLVAKEIGVPSAAQIFYRGFTLYLKPNSTFEDARNSTIQAAADLYGAGSTQYNKTVAAFNTVGLNGETQPPAPNCEFVFECSFGVAMETVGETHAVDGESAAEMLSTLYRARGQLALNSAAGDHFLPLYEEHMPRITELVSQDSLLAEMSVVGLEELTPALNALIEGEGEEFELSAAQMAKIEAALERLAEDDRLYSGPDAGALADLIEEELEWMGLPSYGGMNYESGFNRLNEETEAHTMLVETGEIVDPNCTGQPYSNDFGVNGLYADTPGHRIPGQVSPMNAGGIVCGTLIEEKAGKKECIGEKSLNTEVSVTLPPGDRVNSSKNLPAGSWAGEAIGYGFACAGDESKRIYGQAGLLSLSSWTASQCPTGAVACYEGRTKVNTPAGAVIGKGYAWVIEEGGSLKLVTKPVTVSAPEGYFITVGFGQFEVRLCARAGSAETQSCGGPSATWIHQNGESDDVGCPAGKGRYTMQAKNGAGETTAPVSTCVRWEDEAQMQTVAAPTGFTAVACVPSSTTCIAADSKGNESYATNVSSSAASTWTSWTGPGVSPAEDIACPTTTLCVVAAGAVEGGGGNVYRTSSLGGSWLSSFKPANGVGALSCPTSSFCVAALEGGGYIRYTTNPSGIIWTAVEIGTGAMKDVECLSSSFCAVVDGTGNIRVATSATKVKEAGGWTATSVNGGAALRSVACSSTTSCIAVGGTSKLLNLTIAAGGGATVTSQTLVGAGALSDVACSGTTCAATDEAGGIFGSSNSGATWTKRFEAADKLTGLSCASASLCTGVDSSGDLVKFDPV
jgi:Zn-dependent metalloprotease